MSRFPMFPSGSWRSLFRRRVDDEVDAEIAFHLAMAERDHLGAGFSPADARRMAEAQFGDTHSVRRQMRKIGEQQESSTRRLRWLAEFARDLTLGFRILRRRSTYAVMAIATLALGIGSATALYSLVDGILLRPLPFPQPDRLVALWLAHPALRDDPVLFTMADRAPLGSVEYRAIRDGATTLAQVAMWSTSEGAVATPTGRERTAVVRVTSSMLPVLGVRPHLGRGFEPTDDVLNGPKVALLDWETWQGRFRGDSAVVGGTVTIDETSFRVVGILPPGVRLSVLRDAPPAVWVPALQDAYDLPERRNRGYRALARLQPGTSAQAAQTQVSAILAPFGRPTSPLAARIESWHADQTRDVRRPLWMLLAFSGLLLVVGCANVALLSLSEATARGREFTTRVALGAGTTRLVRQLVAENLALAGAGVAAGCLVAALLIEVLLRAAPSSTPHLAQVGMNVRAVGFAAVCGLGTALLFGLVPALQAARGSQRSVVALPTRSATQRGGVQRLFVALQLAISVLLLGGAALLGQSVYNLSRVEVGFRAAGVTTVRLLVPSSRQARPDDIITLTARVQAALASLRGVSAVGGASTVPFTNGSTSSPVEAEGRTYTPEAPPANANQVAVTPGYFETLAMTVLAGRTINEADRAGSEPVAVVDETLARREFGDPRPLGRRLKHQGEWRRIVGVVANARHGSLTDSLQATVYVPFTQYPYASTGTPIYVLRAGGDLAGVTTAVQRAIREVDPALGVGRVESLSRLVDRSYQDERFRMVLVSAFGMLAAVLVGIGMYGLSMRLALARTREIGIRTALGSPTGAVVRLLMREPMWGLGIGVLMGAAAARHAGQWLQPLLYGVTPGDPRVLGSVIVLLSVLAVTGSLVPSWRAARRPPASALARE